MRSALRALARPSGLGLQQEPSRAPFFESTCRCAAARLYGSLKPSPLREEVEHWSAAQLGRAARRALAEGDLTEARDSRESHNQPRSKNWHVTFLRCFFSVPGYTTT